MNYVPHYFRVLSLSYAVTFSSIYYTGTPITWIPKQIGAEICHFENSCSFPTLFEAVHALQIDSDTGAATTPLLVEQELG